MLVQFVPLQSYDDGSYGLGWERDDEKALARDTAIRFPSLSADRKISVLRKKQDRLVKGDAPILKESFRLLG
ncbi:MAG: hypothetical protein C5B58_10350 [Acidobacteria bacterium]|nr:MAG: hypothetical protein C5B58_10350 [Acidobacteriota bacterium]